MLPRLLRERLRVLLLLLQLLLRPLRRFVFPRCVRRLFCGLERRRLAGFRGELLVLRFRRGGGGFDADLCPAPFWGELLAARAGLLPPIKR